MTDPTPVYKPTPTEKVQKSFRKGKKRGVKTAGWLMSVGGGLVGLVYGVGSGLKQITTELLPEDEEEEEDEPAPAAPNQDHLPPFLQSNAQS